MVFFGEELCQEIGLEIELELEVLISPNIYHTMHIIYHTHTHYTHISENMNLMLVPVVVVDR